MSNDSTTRRRWFSYNLRSLFVLITIAAIGLGWVAYERRQSQREIQVAEQLKASGAAVMVAGLFDPAIRWDTAKPAEQPSWWRRA
jgi:hypothetical protein